MNNNENPNFNLNIINPVENNLENTQPNAQTTVPPTTVPVVTASAGPVETTTPVAVAPVVGGTITPEIGPFVESATTPVVTDAPTMVAVEEQIPTSSPVVSEPTSGVTEQIVPTSRPVTSAPSVVSQTRYNPVTGEEMNLNELTGEKTETEMLDVGAVINDEKLKKVDIEYKPTSKANTVMLIIFFIALIGFVIFLPDIQSLIAEYKAGPQTVEEVITGRLVCTLESSTVNLDREITRIFEFTEMKLQSAKFTTIIRGDATLDEETLNELNAQCQQINSNVEGLEGISVSCTYENGKLTEKEIFDYSSYHAEEVTAAYTEAGGSVLDFEYETNIDTVMTNMRQGGFTCNKEK